MRQGEVGGGNATTISSGAFHSTTPRWSLLPPPPLPSILPIETIGANLSTEKSIHFSYILSSNQKSFYSLSTMLELSF
jgi:hypothetical protein